MYKKDLTLYNQQRFICYKTQPNVVLTQLAGIAKYTDCFSEKG